MNHDFTEQDVKLAWSALKTRRFAAQQYEDPEKLIEATYEPEVLSLADELKFYRRGAEILDAGYFVWESTHFDGTLPGGLHYTEMEEHPRRVSPIARTFAGWVATSEHHCLLCLLAPKS